MPAPNAFGAGISFFLKPRITRMSRMIRCGRIRSTGILPVGPAGVSPAESFDPELQRMGLTGLEPVTLRLSSACSNQLSYRPGKLRGQFIVRSEIRNAISENWTQGDYAPASASDNVPCLLDVASTASRLWRQGDSNP